MAISKYLATYAEEESHAVKALPYDYQYVLTLAAFNETSKLLERLLALPTTAAVLVILVLNAPDKIDSEEKINNTQNLGKHIRKALPRLCTLQENIQLYELNHAARQHLLLVERCYEGRFIPHKKGVGLARKIACDIACMLITQGNISSPWMHNTDADVWLPQDYFEAAETLNPLTCAAAIYPFRHSSAGDEPELERAHMLYELSLDYYVKGLSWAGSTYAFHTIGSILLINHRHYAMCRGFPQRAAGEDFYLLNKLAKTGDIFSLTKPVIEIQARKSDRVPFGTGVSVAKIMSLKNPHSDYLYYNPLCFSYLKHWLTSIPSIWENGDSLTADFFINIDTDDNIDPAILLESLQAINVELALGHSFQQSKTLTTFEGHMQRWFDSFKTLKLIHYLRDNHFPSLPRNEMMAQAPFLNCQECKLSLTMGSDHCPVLLESGNKYETETTA